MTYCYALQIQPRDGNVLLEYRDGIALQNPRVWSDEDRKQFPQAERQVSSNEVLLVDGATKFVFAVPLKQALLAKMTISTVEVDGIVSRA